MLTACLSPGLRDSTSTVRVSAVTGAGKVWRHSPAAGHELGLVPLLYSMLRDPEPTVVTFTLQTLSVVLAEEGGVRVNRKMARYLLTKVVTYKEKEFCFVMDFLFLPDCDEDLTLEILNTLDAFLDHADGNVMLSVAKLFIKLVNNNTSLRISLVKRVTPVFVEYLKSGSHRDFNHNLLEFIRSLPNDYIEALKIHLKVFYTKSKDTEKAKLKKIQFLPKLVTEDTAVETLNFLLNLLPQSKSLNSAIFSSIATISTTEKSSFSHAVINLELLLKTDCDMYAKDILLAADLLELETNVTLDEERAAQLVRTLVSSLQPRALGPAHVSALLTLLEHFSRQLPCAPRVTAELLRADKSAWSPGLYSQMVAASYEVFLAQPVAMQLIMGKVYCIVC